MCQSVVCFKLCDSSGCFLHSHPRQVDSRMIGWMYSSWSAKRHNSGWISVGEPSLHGGGRVPCIMIRCCKLRPSTCCEVRPIGLPQVRTSSIAVWDLRNSFGWAWGLGGYSTPYTCSLAIMCLFSLGILSLCLCTCLHEHRANYFQHFLWVSSVIK